MTWRVLLSDCVAAMRQLPEASVDAIVTDPPYELGFMGRAWDASGIAYSLDLWQEALRVLRPGGHLLAFGGTRTYHRMTCAVEDAGFEVRDSLHWFYGSGFPKSLDVGRAIDEALCTLPGRHYWHEASLPKGAKAEPGDHVCPRTPQGESWDGWGTALKPAHEPIVLARKPLAGEAIVAVSVLEQGTGGLNVDGCRIGFTSDADKGSAKPQGRATAKIGALAGGTQHDGERSEFGPDDAAGRWPPNVLLTHDPNCNGACVLGCPVAALDQQSGNTGAQARVKGTEPRSKTDAIFGKFAGRLEGEFYGDRGGASRFFPTFTWDPVLDVPFLYCAKPARSERDAGLDDVMPTTSGEATEREDDSAGTKSPRAGAGRNGGAKNFHPTVKPIRLMEWLCRLVTPPGGLIVDPFLGSGTTGCAAVRQGFNFIGIELEEPYVQIAVRRIGLAAGAPRAKAIGELVRLKPPKLEEPRAQLGLFGGAT